MKELSFLDSDMEKEIDLILKTLTLKEKVSLLSGKDHWGTVEIESKGIKPVIVTDGPHGVRIGNEDSDREKDGTATAFPTGVAMASTWDVELIREVAIALAEETIANKCDVLLGPCINIVRVPVGNRNFETYSEDPFLAGKIGTGYIQGLQSRGIGASLKHLAANNQELERTRGSSNMDERTLREIYLTAFEMIVKDANPWTIMCSYNRLNGEHTSQSRHLLTEILRDEWGFSGIVVSDWGANHTMFESIKAGLDLEMPGPPLYYGKYLEESVKTWQMEESYINEAARRIIRLSKRVEKYKKNNPDDKGAFSNAKHISLARMVAETSAVLLKNDNNLLPVTKKGKKKIAVIGPCAKEASYGGGGSSIVTCEYTVSPLEGIKNYYGDSAEVVFIEGCKDRAGADFFENVGIHINTGNKKGLLEEYYDNREFKGNPLSSEIVDSIDHWNLFAPKGIDRANFSVRWSGDMTVDRTGEYKFYFSYQGNFNFLIDDETIVSDPDWQDVDPFPFYTIKKKVVTLEKGKTYKFSFDFVNTLNNERQAIILKADYLFNEDEVTKSINQAVELAKSADQTFLFAGHATGYEVEGKDRKSLKLPGEQNRLISEIINADKDTVLVLNTGAPIEMPWIDDVKSVIQAHFFGQEGGNAIADILHGDINPSGKLSTSYPIRNQDNPSYLYYPGEREHNFGEGVFVGYRYYDFKEMDVLFPFGHGLSYTSFDYSDLKISGSLEEANLQATVTVKNSGDIIGSEVVQLYVSDVKCPVPRPKKELKGFDKVELKPGESTTITFKLDPRSFSYWDNFKNDWRLDSGEFEILIGASSRDIRVTKSLEIK